MPTLPTDVVAGQAGHVGHTNELHALFNEPLGECDFVKRYDPASTQGATDETARLQTAIDENVNNTIYLNGIYTINAPLILPTGTRLARGTIWAGASFDFSATVLDAVGVAHPVAMLMLENGGFVYSLARCYFDRLTLSGLDRPNSRGFLGALQQPAVWHRFRVEHCADYGMRIKGQQTEFHSTMVLDCGTGINLNNFSFARFYSLNMEGNTVGLTGGAADTEIFGGHYESNDIDFLIPGGTNWQFYGGRHTSQTGKTSFKIDAGREVGYRIIRAHSSATTNTGVAIEDVNRGFIHNWWEDFRGNIHDFDMLEVPTASSYTDKLGHVIGSAAGRRVRFGGRYAATYGVEAGTSGLRQAEHFDSAGVRQFVIDSQGRPVLPLYTAVTRPTASVALNGVAIINTDTHRIEIVEGGIWRDAMGTPL